MMDTSVRLAALEEIRALKARFFFAVDDQDWAAYADLFTADAQFSVGDPFGPACGAAALAQATSAVGGQAMANLLAHTLAGAATIHIAGLPVISFSGENAAQVCRPVEDWIWFAAGHQPKCLHGFGRYHDQMLRTSCGWRIARLSYTRTRYADTGAAEAAGQVGQL